jgi:hypothetical protein
MDRIQWQVLNVDDLKAMLDKLQKTNDNIAVFALNGDDYAKMSANMERLKQYISELQIAVQEYIDIIQARYQNSKTAADTATDKKTP